MAECVLVTGGAGFIGRHVVKALLAQGREVRVFDCLDPQVHGASPAKPEGAALMQGDIRDGDAVARALKGADAVVHLASAVGVGQSMYEIAAYTAVNELGTAVLWEALSRDPKRRVVVASSMSIYGEGLAADARGNIRTPAPRSTGAFELADAEGHALSPLATPESKPPSLHSVYALNKYAQEQMSLILGRAYRIPAVALRFFNVYGPGQALGNPYTGVLAIFASRLLNNRPPLIFEDGAQMRDFIHVEDAARAVLMALDTRHADDVFNAGSGTARSILSVAEDFARVLGKPIAPEITGKMRAGDIRHCFADTSKARGKMGFTAETDFMEGLAGLAAALEGEKPQDLAERARRELAERGLVA